MFDLTFQTSHLRCPMFDLTSPMSDVQYHISNVPCLISHLRCPMFNLTSHISDVRCSISHLRCPMFDLTSPMSHVRSLISDVPCSISHFKLTFLMSDLTFQTHIFDVRSPIFEFAPSRLSQFYLFRTLALFRLSSDISHFEFFNLTS